MWSLTRCELLFQMWSWVIEVISRVSMYDREPQFSVTSASRLPQMKKSHLWHAPLKLSMKTEMETKKISTYKEIQRK